MRRAPGPGSGRSSRCRGSSAGPRTSRTGPRCRPEPRRAWSSARAGRRPGLGDHAVDGAAERRRDPAVPGGQRARCAAVAGGADRAVVAPVAWDEREQGQQQDEDAESDPAEACHGEDLRTSGVTSPPLSTRVTGESSAGVTPTVRDLSVARRRPERWSHRCSCVITGGGGGLGEMIVRAVRERGWLLPVVVDADGGAAVRAAGSSGVAVAADLRDPDVLPAIVSGAVASRSAVVMAQLRGGALVS